jgi:predicted SprT family Zn-dependent metalloprotease
MSEYLDENNEHKYRCDFCGIDNLSEEDINETDDGNKLCDECYVRYLEGEI